MKRSIIVLLAVGLVHSCSLQAKVYKLFNVKTNQFEQKGENPNALDACIFLEETTPRFGSAEEKKAKKGIYPVITDDMRNAITHKQLIVSSPALIRALITMAEMSPTKLKKEKKIPQEVWEAAVNDLLSENWLLFRTEHYKFGVFINKETYPNIIGKGGSIDLPAIGLNPKLATIPNNMQAIKQDFKDRKETRGPIDVKSLCNIFLGTKELRVYLTGHGAPSPSAHIAGLAYKKYDALLDCLEKKGCIFLHIFTCYGAGWNAFVMHQKQTKGYWSDRKLSFPIGITSGSDTPAALFDSDEIDYASFFFNLNQFLTSDLQKNWQNKWETWFRQKPWIYKKTFAEIFKPIAETDYSETIHSIRIPGMDDFRAVATSPKVKIITLPDLLKLEIETVAQHRKKLNALFRKYKRYTLDGLQEIIFQKMDALRKKAPLKIRELDIYEKNIKEKMSPVWQKLKETLLATNPGVRVFSELLKDKKILDGITAKITVDKNVYLLILYPSIIPLPMIFEGERPPNVLSFIPGPSHHLIEKIIVKKIGYPPYVLENFGHKYDLYPRLFFVREFVFENYDESSNPMFPFKVQAPVLLKNVAIKRFGKEEKKPPECLCEYGEHFYHAKITYKNDVPLIGFKEIKLEQYLKILSEWMTKTAPNPEALRRSTQRMESEAKFQNRMARILAKKFKTEKETEISFYKKTLAAINRTIVCLNQLQFFLGKKDLPLSALQKIIKKEQFITKLKTDTNSFRKESHQLLVKPVMDNEDLKRNLFLIKGPHIAQEFITRLIKLLHILQAVKTKNDVYKETVKRATNALKKTLPKWKNAAKELPEDQDIKTLADALYKLLVKTRKVFNALAKFSKPDEPPSN